MNFNDYQKSANRTLKCDLYRDQKLSMLCMGLSGESGEVTDLFKKQIYHGHRIAIKDIVKELGDVLWYLSGIATTCGVSLEDIAIENIEKLEKRYPDGFSYERSINRSE